MEQRQSAIVNGSLDNGHPAVGVLHSGGKAACTATLVGSKTVLTAAHCVVTENAPYKLLSPVHFYVGGFKGTKYVASSVAVHANYAGGNKSDIAVVRLSKSVTNVTPMIIANQGPVTGEKVTLVGYGKTSEKADDFGTKRKATNVVYSITTQTYSLKGTSSGHGNICNGDSGGPTFIWRGNREVVLGVHSTKTNFCGYAGTDMRVDAFYNWISMQALGDLQSDIPQDTQPPQVKIMSPLSGAQVSNNLVVKVTAMDDQQVARVALFVGGKKSGEKTSPPYDFTIKDLAAGSHTLEAVAFDKAGHSSSSTITVIRKNAPPPSPNTRSPFGGTCTKNMDCVSSICIAGSAGYCSKMCQTAQDCPGGYTCDNAICRRAGAPPTKGAYGAACDGPAQCDSGLCAVDAVTGQRFCTMFCDLSHDTCPQSAMCQPAGQTAVCAPLHDGMDWDEDGMTGGCSVSGAAASSSGPLWLLALFLLAARRRPRR